MKKTCWHQLGPRQSIRMICESYVQIYTYTYIYIHIYIYITNQQAKVGNLEVNKFEPSWTRLATSESLHFGGIDLLE